ncbi:hypothetical protein L914_14201 [Phytophthora nicotianae]|uniref:Uncharacterized protein n=1 Tax=Phytophthora nicotianae TaxID=4792 RepID=W2MTM0_PHYNI|nr:hypothetical protein L914_14201 [Phytophthora nicotianae]
MVDVYFEFVWESCYWSVTVQVVGCYSHGLRYYWTCRPSRRTGLGSNVKKGWTGLAGRIGQREERERASLERLRGTPKKGTPKEVQDGEAKPYGTPTGGVPEVVAGETVRPAVEGTTRRGRRGSVGEDCHGLQLEGGLAILADCIQKVCLIQGQRATSSKTGQEEQTSAFHV